MGYRIEFDDHLGVIQAHLAWKEQFSGLVARRSSGPVLEMLSDRCCYLKKWLQIDAKEKFGETVAYKKCVDVYSDFYNEAVEISNLVCKGDFLAAERRALSGIAFSDASRELVVSIALMFLGGSSR